MISTRVASNKVKRSPQFSDERHPPPGDFTATWDCCFRKTRAIIGMEIACRKIAHAGLESHPQNIMSGIGGGAK